MQIHGISERASTGVTLQQAGRDELRHQRVVVAGGILGALAASSCCVVPLLLFSLGIGGAWIANLTALAPYKPLFVAATAALLGYGFYSVYWKPKYACAADAACARPLPNRVVKVGLWIATVLVVIAFGFDYIAPVLLAA
ncbi:MAG: mercury transporter MerT [Rhodospirillaceae bacterium]|nr:mercury transporter MerT [Rhodospirillaceae bacterium]